MLNFLTNYLYVNINQFSELKTENYMYSINPSSWFYDNNYLLPLSSDTDKKITIVIILNKPIGQGFI